MVWDSIWVRLSNNAFHKGIQSESNQQPSPPIKHPPKTNMTGWNITFFLNKRYIDSNDCFSIVMLDFVFGVHPGRLTWNLQITHLERKMIWTKPPGNYRTQPLIFRGVVHCLGRCHIVTLLKTSFQLSSIGPVNRPIPPLSTCKKTWFLKKYVQFEESNPNIPSHHRRGWCVCLTASGAKAPGP